MIKSELMHKNEMLARNSAFLMGVVTRIPAAVMSP